MKTIACCTDFSKNADAAYNAALDLAEKYKARLDVIHVLSPLVNPVFPYMSVDISEENRPALLPEIERRMQEKYIEPAAGKAVCKPVILDGHASTEIIAYLGDKAIDLVVMGSYGLSGMGLVIFGSVAKRVAHKAPCSVMIVRNHD